MRKTLESGPKRNIPAIFVRKGRFSLRDRALTTYDDDRDGADGPLSDPLPAVPRGGLAAPARSARRRPRTACSSGGWMAGCMRYRRRMR